MHGARKPSVSGAEMFLMLHGFLAHHTSLDSPKTHEDVNNYNFMQIKADKNRLVHTFAELSDISHTVY